MPIISATLENEVAGLLFETSPGEVIESISETQTKRKKT
jgi:hypothetical protein